MTKFKVVFLLDKSNDWLGKYLKLRKIFPNNKKFQYKISYNPNTIKNQDVVFVLSYTKILKESFLKRNKLTLVVHESNLPKNKGFAPVQWQILEGKNRIPINLIKAEKHVDSGVIYEKDYFQLNGDELYDEIRKKQALAKFKIIKKFLNKFPKNKAIPQRGSSNYNRKRMSFDSRLNLNKKLIEQFNLLRIANNDDWPSFFYHKNNKYIIKIYKK
ncbi:MAG: Methionyl-tRNA formyltransferase [Alphaproteobacteria bacterium MarineAlpha5_Bin11]|nr:methionyl-tRNA formyltransferase [Pelagibacteraceae bacterium]PPR42259.1 MAG: Methionyl-tRNA formyltransferase [Alphaproteobacteria bacterium MarineAlpha5_Bin11]|tara:strand:- start:872 stop:1516 length:645 start_codon:yes stop_codon:yes gene_type:complete